MDERHTQHRLKCTHLNTGWEGDEFYLGKFKFPPRNFSVEQTAASQTEKKKYNKSGTS